MVGDSAESVLMLVTPAGQAAHQEEIWTQDLRVSGVHERRAVRPSVRRLQPSVVFTLLIATGLIATFDLYLLAASGLH